MLELGVCAVWGTALFLFFGPVGLLIGFLTPILNTIAGVCAIWFTKGEVSYRGFSNTIYIKGQWGALSIGSVIMGDDYLYSNRLPHEQGHSFQSLLLGPLYWLVIAIPSITWAALLKYNILKTPANMYSNDYYYTFYTEKWAEAWKR